MAAIPHTAIPQVGGSTLAASQDGFIQTGTFYLWVETSEASKKRKTAQNIHPYQLFKSDLEAFLSQGLGIKSEQRSHPALISNFAAIFFAAE